MKPILIDKVREAQYLDHSLNQLRETIQNGSQLEFTIRGDGTLIFGTRLCVPNDQNLEHEILEEAHSSAYVVHPSGTKMYRTLREHYLWPNMKREIATYISRCPVCQQVEEE